MKHFKKSEHQERGADEYHGIGGPLKGSDLRLRRPIADCFIQAATEIGIPRNEDYNGASQEGASIARPVKSVNGLRGSRSFCRALAVSLQCTGCTGPATYGPQTAMS